MPDNSDGQLVFIFIFTALTYGVIIRYVLTRLHRYIATETAYTSCLLLLSCVIGLAQLQVRGADQSLNQPSASASDLTMSQTLMANVNPHLVEFVFLPIIVLEAAFVIDLVEFKRLLPIICLLAVPGVVTTALLTSILVFYGLHTYGWDWLTCLLFGAILVATDTNIVVSGMRQLGVGQRLSTIIESESLLVDAVAYILFAIFSDLLSSVGSTSLIDAQTSTSSVNIGYEFGNFFQQIICGPLFGLGIAICTVAILHRIFRDIELELVISVMVAYIIYFVSTEYIYISGNLAVVTYGLYFSAHLRQTITSDVLHSLHDMINVLAYISRTMIFVLSGILISHDLFVSTLITGTDVAYAIVLYVFIMFTRGLASALLAPLIRLMGYKFNWKDVILMSWSGIRGSQCLILGLLASLDTRLIPLVNARIGFQVSAIVLLTNLINGLLVKTIVKLLNFNNDSAASHVVLSQTLNRISKATKDQLDEMPNSNEFHNLDWSKVINQLDVGTLLDLGSMVPGRKSIQGDSVEASKPELAAVYQDIVVRFLEMYRLTVSELYDIGELTGSAANALYLSIDSARDRNDLTALWESMESFAIIPAYLKLLYESKTLRFFRLKLLNQVIERYVLTHFLTQMEIFRAASIAYNKFDVLLKHMPVQLINQDITDHHDINIAEELSSQCQVYNQRAAKRLNDLTLSYPALSSAIQTRHATMNALMKQRTIVTELSQQGLLTSVESQRLSNEIYRRIHYVKRTQLLHVKQLLSADALFMHSPYFCHFNTHQQNEIVRRASTILVQPYSFQRSSPEHLIFTVVHGRFEALYHSQSFMIQARTSEYIDKRIQSWSLLRQNGNYGDADHGANNCEEKSSARELSEEMCYADLFGAFTAVRLLSKVRTHSHGIDLIDSSIPSWRSLGPGEIRSFNLEGCQRMLTDMSFTNMLYRSAADECFKQYFSHLDPYCVMSAVTMTRLLRASTTYHCNEVATVFQTPPDARVLIVCGVCTICSVYDRHGQIVRHSLETDIIQISNDSPALIKLDDDMTIEWSLSSWGFAVVWSISIERAVLEQGHSSTDTNSTNFQSSMPLTSPTSSHAMRCVDRAKRREYPFSVQNSLAPNAELDDNDYPTGAANVFSRIPSEVEMIQGRDVQIIDDDSEKPKLLNTRYQSDDEKINM